MGCFGMQAEEEGRLLLRIVGASIIIISSSSSITRTGLTTTHTEVAERWWRGER